jgi:hypothetical protein
MECVAEGSRYFKFHFDSSREPDQSAYCYAGGAPQRNVDPFGLKPKWSCVCCESEKARIERSPWYKALAAKDCVRGIYCVEADEVYAGEFDPLTKLVSVLCPSRQHPYHTFRHELSHAAVHCGLCHSAFSGLDPLRNCLADEYSARRNEGLSPADSEQRAKESCTAEGFGTLNEVREAADAMNLEQMYWQCLREAHEGLQGSGK